MDICPPGGGIAPISYDATWSLRKRIRLMAPYIGDKCLQMRAIVYEAPVNGVTLYTADYYHSGNVNYH